MVIRQIVERTRQRHQRKSDENMSLPVPPWTSSPPPSMADPHCLPGLCAPSEDEGSSGLGPGRSGPAQTALLGGSHTRGGPEALTSAPSSCGGCARQPLGGMARGARPASHGIRPTLGNLKLPDKNVDFWPFSESYTYLLEIIRKVFTIMTQNPESTKEVM